MPDTSMDFDEFQQQLQEHFQTLTSHFNALQEALPADTETDVVTTLQSLYKKYLRTHQEITNGVKNVKKQTESAEKRLNQLQREKQRLEVLYSTGITFSSELEMKSLLEKAIEIVVREMKADAGFIVLVDANGSFEDIYSQNMNVENHPGAEEMSRTVIREAMQDAAPVTVDDRINSTLAQKSSIIRLGISAAMCVPLIYQETVFGAVYLDRRDKANAFTESDLSYFLAFARQIVQGLKATKKFTRLERELFADSYHDFEKLRERFDCAEIIGSSPKLFEILKLASKIAPSDASVLILGESGTGKDLLARTIHKNSDRSDKAFVTIDCGSIPADLLESELFGYEKGAFTGATQAKPGKLEVADGGTVFLNEIGEMPVNLQAKLLRIIQTGEVERLGGIETRQIDARFLAATNKDISKNISEGTFREDLYYRLKVFELYMPSLAERREDIPDLVHYFMKKFASDGQVPDISPEAMHLLEEYPWPGNIRELSNVIQRSVVLAKDDMIRVSDLPKEQVEQTNLDPYIESGKTLHEAERIFRKNYIIKTLKQADSKTEAAEILGINRTHFHKLLSKFNIS